jgi:hypothetical protein
MHLSLLVQSCLSGGVTGRLDTLLHWFLGTPSPEFHSTTPTGSLSLTQKHMIWNRLTPDNDVTCILEFWFEFRRDNSYIELRCILLSLWIRGGTWRSLKLEDIIRIRKTEGRGDVRELRRKKHFRFLMFLSSTRLTYLCSRLQRQRDSRKDSRREREKKAMAVVGYIILQILGTGTL